MKFIIHTDDNKYVIGLELSTKEEAIEIPDEVYESHDLTCYKFEDGKFTFDEDKKAKLEQKENDRMEIEQLKKQLADTDYVCNKIIEGVATKEDYADVLKQREEWRERIRTLSNE